MPPLYTRLRENLRAALRAERITQRELARRAGVAEQSLSGFLKGKRGLSVESIDKIVQALGIDVAALFQTAPPDPSRHASPVQLGQGGTSDDQTQTTIQALLRTIDILSQELARSSGRPRAATPPPPPRDDSHS